MGAYILFKGHVQINHDHGGVGPRHHSQLRQSEAWGYSFILRTLLKERV